MMDKMRIRKVKRYIKDHNPQIINRFSFFKYPSVQRIEVKLLNSLGKSNVKEYDNQINSNEFKYVFTFSIFFLIIEHEEFKVLDL